MSLSIWRSLTDTERQAWNDWAAVNPIFDEVRDEWRIVSGRRALDHVLANRARAGEEAYPATQPGAEEWLAGQVFSLRDAGPFTVGAGYMGLRAEQAVAAGSKWFIWATPPVATETIDPDLLRFITCLTIATPLAFDDVVTSFAEAYRSVCGDWRGPGVNGVWDVPTNVLFRVHQYADGQIGPRTVMMNGLITEEL